MKTKNFSEFTINVKVLSTEKRKEFQELPPELREKKLGKNIFHELDNLDNSHKNKSGIEDYLNSLRTSYHYVVEHTNDNYVGVIYGNFRITRKKIGLVPRIQNFILKKFFSQTKAA